MHNHTGGPTTPVGPPREHVVYLNEHHRETERMFFWNIIAAMFLTFKGDYEDVPECFREEGTAQLLNN